MRGECEHMRGECPHMRCECPHGAQWCAHLPRHRRCDAPAEGLDKRLHLLLPQRETGASADLWVHSAQHNGLPSQGVRAAVATSHGELEAPRRGHGRGRGGCGRRRQKCLRRLDGGCARGGRCTGRRCHASWRRQSRRRLLLERNGPRPVLSVHAVARDRAHLAASQLGEATQKHRTHRNQRSNEHAHVLARVWVGQAEPHAIRDAPARQVHPAAVSPCLRVHPAHAQRIFLDLFMGAELGTAFRLAARAARPGTLHSVLGHWLLCSLCIELPRGRVRGGIEGGKALLCRGVLRGGKPKCRRGAVEECAQALERSPCLPEGGGVPSLVGMCLERRLEVCTLDDRPFLGEVHAVSERTGLQAHASEAGRYGARHAIWHAAERKKKRGEKGY